MMAQTFVMKCENDFGFSLIKTYKKHREVLREESMN